MSCCNKSGKGLLFLFPLALLAFVAIMAKNFPEMRRYLRIERM